MTDFERIKAYYRVFDEQHRLEKPEGRLEFDISMDIILGLLGKADKVLDLGGGAGRYSIELAKRGFRVTLADLSPRLLEQARRYIAENSIPSLQGIDNVNAIDISLYESGSFDAVILFGPLYHLLEEGERRSCVAEIFRVLRPGGLVFANFIPYLSGLAGAISRAMHFPDQADAETLSGVFVAGEFKNNAKRGFQEGYYPRATEVDALFAGAGFEKLLLRSVRGIGYNREEKLYGTLKNDGLLYDKIVELINSTAADPAIVETSGHAIYVGRKGL